MVSLRARGAVSAAWAGERSGAGAVHSGEGALERDDVLDREGPRGVRPEHLRVRRAHAAGRRGGGAAGGAARAWVTPSRRMTEPLGCEEKRSQCWNLVGALVRGKERPDVLPAEHLREGRGVSN